MRKFIDIVDRIALAEGRSKYLYHGTSIVACASIINQDVIHAQQADTGPNGVSLTSNPRVAGGFALDVDDREIEIIRDNMRSDAVPTGPTKPRGAILVFDGEKLRMDQNVQAFRWDNSGSEREERVRGSGFAVAPYLVEIRCRAEDIRTWLDIILPFELDFFEKNAEHAWAKEEIPLLRKNISVVRALLDHPRRKER